MHEFLTQQTFQGMSFPLILMRHSESAHNSTKQAFKQQFEPASIKSLPFYTELVFDQALQDPCLTPKGILQCEQLAQILHWNQIDHILTSPSKRCLQTCDILLKGNHSKIPVRAEPLLMNRISNAWSLGSSKSKLEELYPFVDFSRVPEGNIPWYIQILSQSEINRYCKQREKHPTNTCLQLLKHGFQQSYSKFHERSCKLRDVILEQILKKESGKRLLIISHQCILKLFTGTHISTNDKIYSEISFRNASPLYVEQSMLFRWINAQIVQ